MKKKGGAKKSHRYDFWSLALLKSPPRPQGTRGEGMLRGVPLRELLCLLRRQRKTHSEKSPDQTKNQELPTEVSPKTEPKQSQKPAAKNSA